MKFYGFTKFPILLVIALLLAFVMFGCDEKRHIPAEGGPAFNAGDTLFADCDQRCEIYNYPAPANVLIVQCIALLSILEKSVPYF